MAQKINKTNAARLLDQQKIAYELVTYEVDENDLSAPHVAASLGEPVEQVFKTIVLHGDKTGHFVCVIPGEAEIDLKLAAKVSGNKSCALLPLKELLPLTGYIRGGCSPIGMKKHLPTYFQRAAWTIRSSTSAPDSGACSSRLPRRTSCALPLQQLPNCSKL